ncbi:MAG: DUF1428 domain-containing protein [Methylococcaceae bacterium]|nr:DUF1428 domain-containing protein [Methylococcaceae bacterium]
MSYVDAYVLPLPTQNIEAYREMAENAGKIWMEHGALVYKECIAEDMNSEWAKDTFPKSVNALADETVIFAFIVFKSREHRDEVNAKVHKDPRLAGCGSMETMPFDMNRMTYGGFTTLVDL